MPKIIRLLVAALAVSSMGASAQEAGPNQQEFTPRSVPARVVVVISGQSGMNAYKQTAQQIANAGFQVVLVDGNDFWIKDTRRAWGMLRGVMPSAQAGPNVLPGKVGVVGFSLGGASTLTCATRMPDLVATAVAAHPLTSFIKDPADFVGKIEVPVQVFAGTTDTTNNCSLIDMVRQLAAAAKAQPSPMLARHEYNGVGHGFDLPNAAQKDVAAGQDAMGCTIAILKLALPGGGCEAGRTPRTDHRQNVQVPPQAASGRPRLAARMGAGSAPCASFMRTRRRHLLLSMASAVMLVSFVPVVAQETRPEYEIRSDRPEPGSLIRRQAVRGSVLPINRTYAQLTPEEKAILHGWYERIPPGDEPPFPAEGLKPVFEAFLRGQDKLGVTGELFLIASVDAQGDVAEVQAIGSPSPEMVKFAATVLILTKFKPAVCSGRPCRMEFPLLQYFGVR